MNWAALFERAADAGAEETDVTDAGVADADVSDANVAEADVSEALASCRNDR